MWILILISITAGGNSAPSIESVDGFSSKEACVNAVKFSKARELVRDAYCLSKK